MQLKFFKKKYWKLTLMLILLGAIYIIPSGCETDTVVQSESQIVSPELLTAHTEKQEKPLVGSVSRKTEPEDAELFRMIEDVIRQTLGKDGLATIVKKGDRVVIKVNFVGPNFGVSGEIGRGVNSDARIVRHVA